MRTPRAVSRMYVGATRVIFCGPKDAPVLGHIALEELGFTLDVKRGELRKYRRQMISIRRAAPRG